MNVRRTAVWAALAISLFATPLFAQKGERTQVPDRYKWNLTDLYATDAAWKEAKDKFAPQVTSIEQFKGKLGQSPSQLADALDRLFTLQREFLKLYVYASMSSDQDTRVSTYQALQQEISKVGADLSSAVAFFEPEVLSLGQEKVNSFIAAEPRLAVYKKYLGDILRRGPHTGTEGEESIIAAASLLGQGPSDARTIFANADFPAEKVTLSDGSTPTLDQPTFGRLRTLPNREDRKKVFATYFNSLGKYRATFGALLNAQVQRDIFYAKARKYDTSLQSALDANNIPTSVYHSLISGVNEGLPALHRYLKMRKQLLGVDQLHYYDLYAPLIAGVDTQYPIEKAEPIILAAMAPLGKDYVDVLKESFEKRWIDLYPTTGKRSGAYSQGAAYDVHPYMLLNYTDTYLDMSTLAHELGHTMQSYFSNKKQPFPTADYPIFVAEVASTFNEALLTDYMLKTVKDDNVRLAILGDYLEGLRTTVFRQTQFAEFELRVHEMAERGEPLTGDSLSKLYEEIVKKYYGHDQGVTVVDEEVKYEWMMIPHFYYNFYVFQYATSYTASAALSEKFNANRPVALQKYRDFLAAGGSKYPIDLLKDAGVDMTSAEPLQLTVKKMNRVMDEIETLLAKTRGKAKTATK
jgi:oligoendopeptidase F